MTDMNINREWAKLVDELVTALVTAREYVAGVHRSLWPGPAKDAIEAELDKIDAALRASGYEVPQ